MLNRKSAFGDQQSGCDQLQGYVISKPLLLREFEQMVVNA